MAFQTVVEHAKKMERLYETECKDMAGMIKTLKRVIKERDQLAALIEREAKDIDGSGDEIGAKQLRRAVREILSENAPSHTSRP